MKSKDRPPREKRRPKDFREQLEVAAPKSVTKPQTKPADDKEDPKLAWAIWGPQGGDNGQA